MFSHVSKTLCSEHVFITEEKSNSTTTVKINKKGRTYIRTILSSVFELYLPSNPYFVWRFTEFCKKYFCLFFYKSFKNFTKLLKHTRNKVWFWTALSRSLKSIWQFFGPSIFSTNVCSKLRFPKKKKGKCKIIRFKRSLKQSKVTANSLGAMERWLTANKHPISASFNNDIMTIIFL